MFRGDLTTEPQRKHTEKTEKKKFIDRLCALRDFSGASVVKMKFKI